MSANADDPLVQAAQRICDGTPVDWRRIRELLTSRDQETIANELELIEHFARASGGESAVALSGVRWPAAVSCAAAQTTDRIK